MDVPEISDIRQSCKVSFRRERVSWKETPQACRTFRLSHAICMTSALAAKAGTCSGSHLAATSLHPDPRTSLCKKAAAAAATRWLRARRLCSPRRRKQKYWQWHEDVKSHCCCWLWQRLFKLSQVRCSLGDRCTLKEVVHLLSFSTSRVQQRQRRTLHSSKRSV